MNIAFHKAAPAHQRRGILPFTKFSNLKCFCAFKLQSKFLNHIL